MLGFGFDLLEFSDVLTKWFRSVHQAENKTLEELSRLIREISLLSLLRIFNIFLMEQSDGPPTTLAPEADGQWEVYDKA